MFHFLKSTLTTHFRSSKLVFLLVMFLVSPTLAAHFEETTMEGIAIVPPRSIPADFRFIDEQSTAVTSGDVFKQWSLVYIGYTRCGSTCPTDLVKVGQFFKQNAAQLNDVQLFMISADPKNDTPEILENYLSSFDSRFHGLVSTDGRIDDIMNFFESPLRLSVVRKTSEIVHTSNMYLIDRWGRWHQSYTFPFSEEEVIDDITSLKEQLD